jgi:hypothetical protein
VRVDPKLWEPQAGDVIFPSITVKSKRLTVIEKVENDIVYFCTYYVDHAGKHGCMTIEEYKERAKASVRLILRDGA